MPPSVLPSKPMTWIAKSGARLGDRYVLEAKVGEGGMGEVWRAKHLALENEVAIKFLSGSLAGNDETKKRFLMEAKLTAQLRSRHAVQVFDFGLTEDGQPYLVMELLHGEPLGDRIEREKKLSLSAVAHAMNAAAKALHRAHALGIVHRDFKPDNVFLTKGEEEEEVKVVDFGIAKLIGSLDEARPSATDMAELTGRALSTLTRTGRMVGTPHYMSPEQVRMAEDVGPATDIWAFGVVAFESLTGVCPFEGNSVITLFANIQLGKSLKASELNPDVPPAFDDWFKVACCTEPSLRFPDAQTAATLLADALGVVVGSRAARPADSSSRLPFTSSPDISLVSSTDSASGLRADALTRSPSKNTLLSSTVDGSIPMKRSRTALWLTGGVALVLGAAIAVVRFGGTHANPPQPAAASHDAPPSLASAQPVVSASPQPSAAPSATPSDTATATPEASATQITTQNTPPNTGKVHGSGKHTHAGDRATAAPSQPATGGGDKPASTATSGSGSPFSLPPLGL